MAKSRESGGGDNYENNDHQNKSKRAVDNQHKQNRDNSIENYVRGEDTTPESLSHRQKAEAYRTETDALKAQIERDEYEIKAAESRKKTQEALGKEEAVVAAEAQNTTPENLDKTVEGKVLEAANEALATAPELVAKLEAEGKITSEQNKKMQEALKAPDARSKVKNFFHRLKDSATWSSVAGFATGAAAKGAIRLGVISAFSGSLPAILVAGAAAGGLVEGVRAAVRERKKYDNSENIKRLNEEPNAFKKAAILNKLQEAYENQKLLGNQEDLKIASDALITAKTQLEAFLHSKDTKFEKESDKDKLMFLLKVSDSNRKSIERSTKREANQILKDMDRSLLTEKKWSNVKGRWKTIGIAALKGATFGTIGAGVGYAVASLDFGGNPTGALKNTFGSSSTERSQELIQSLQKEGEKALMNHNFAEQIGAKGITGAYRDMLHDYVIQQRVINPNFAPNLNLENLVYAEDYLKDLALEKGTPTGEGVIRASGAELYAALNKGTNIDEKAVKSIGKLVGAGKHHISDAVRSYMMDHNVASFHNVDNDVISQIMADIKTKMTVGAVGNGQAVNQLFSNDSFYSDAMKVIITNAIVEESLMYGRNSRNNKPESEFKQIEPVSEQEKPVTNTEAKSIPTTSKIESSKVENKEFEFRKQTKAEIDQKLKKAGVKVNDGQLGLVWDVKGDLNKQKEIALRLTDNLIQSYKKHVKDAGIAPLILEYNFNSAGLSEVEDKMVSDGLSLRIPSGLGQSDYDSQFKKIFKKHRNSSKAKSKSEAKGTEVEKSTEAVVSNEVKNEILPLTKTEFLAKYKKDSKIKLTSVIESPNFKRDFGEAGISTSEMYGNLDELLQQMKQQDFVSEEEWASLKKIKIINKYSSDYDENIPDVLYIDGESMRNLDLQDDTQRGGLKGRISRRIKAIHNLKNNPKT